MIETPWAVTPTDRRKPPEPSPDSRAPARLPLVDVPAQRKAAGIVSAALVLVVVAICRTAGGAA